MENNIPNLVSQNGKIRESNFELLRLICMFFILLHHLIYHGLGYSHNSVFVAFNSFFIIAVNCFILISGYFGIKASWRGFFHLYIFCVSYNLVFSLLQYQSVGNSDLKVIFYSFLPFSHGQDIWFIPCYFFLFLLSPMLNKVIGNCNKQEFVALLFIWAIITFYFGHLWKNPINFNGYNIMNFIFLYFIGRFIALHIANITTIKRRLLYSSIYLLCSFAGLILIQTKFVSIAFITRNFYIYNAPLVIISAVSFFLFFRTLSFRSKIINWAAKSALAVYLIHENGFVHKYLYEYLRRFIVNTNSEWLLAIELLFFAVVVLVSCILIDKIRLILTNPIEKIINKVGWGLYTDRLIVYVAKWLK